MPAELVECAVCHARKARCLMRELVYKGYDKPRQEFVCREHPTALPRNAARKRWKGRRERCA